MGANSALRQQMEQHRANAICASCHSRMDPLGFALENYDGVGEWRAKDAGSPIDASGKLPDGTHFNGPAGLQHPLLTAHRDEFLATVTEKLLTYALGRGLEYYDKPAIRAIAREAAERKLSFLGIGNRNREKSTVPNEENPRTMIVTKKSLHRRTFLRGIGTTLALPFLDAMVPALRASGAAKPDVRLASYTFRTGDHEGLDSRNRRRRFRVHAHYEGAGAIPRPRCVFSSLTQISGRALGDGAGDHARAGATWLTGVHPKKTEVDIHAGISADQIAAQELGKNTQLASLELGLEEPTLAGDCDSGYSCAYTNTISWRTPTTPIPVEVNPRAVFERLFGDGDSTDPAARLAAMKESPAFSIMSAAMWLASRTVLARATATNSINTWKPFATSSAAFRKPKSRTPPSRCRLWNGPAECRKSSKITPSS